jgi:hypothetical protein
MLAVIVLAVASARARADEPKPEDTVGTWRGKAAWKGCTVTGGPQSTVEVTWKDGFFHAALAGVRDDLGDVTLSPQADGTTTGADHDLKVTFKPGATGRMTLASDGGCTATVTLARDTSGVAGCDRLLALADVESTCDAAGEARAEHLTLARGKLAGWKKLRGKARKTASDACSKDADALASSLVQQGCLPGAGGVCTGVPECDAYVAILQRYAQCGALPVEAKQSLQQAVMQMADAWKGLRDPSVAPEARKAAADACKQASDALRQAAQAQNCPI